MRLVHMRHTSTSMAIFGITVHAGSADETPDNYGLAHFVEHTIFKGTSRRSSWHIINRMEAVGGELNAYTTKEATVVYTIFPSGEGARAIELVADLAINSRFPERELNKEREVVIDEINSYLDTPSEAVFDDFEDMYFAGTSLGHNILGNPESVAQLGSADCRDFLQCYYRRGNMVAFYSGPAGAEQVARMIGRYFSTLPAGNTQHAVAAISNPPKNVHIVKPLPIHQSHTVYGALVGAEGIRRYAVGLFTNIIGGPGMNSLLNMELRERRGLVYSVDAGTTFFAPGALLTVYYGCDESDRALCASLCRRIFERLASSALTPRQLERAKKQYSGQLAIARENRENNILGAARATLFYGHPTTEAEVYEAIGAVSNDDIRLLASQMLEGSSLSLIPE